ncbi:EAL domain-containing protein [Novosphingobium sp. FSY-8]|uniref:EAL domain-containing protein n=1 Tax=Novosphingobium ovatum TaxID=1908523 RepID=A0ABW9XG59_9SPHN|nr:EAL domain-containing protein [Novosphingobium ovatum]NBC37536.1 EAL domain-containing protein [Novosphingobium ovatum]
MAPEQIADNLAHVPMAVLGGMMNALASAAAMWSSGHHGAILSWYAAILGVCGMRLHLARRRNRGGITTIEPARDGLIIETLSLIYGLIWGVGIAATGFIANSTQFCIIALLSGGMMGAAVLSYSAMARGAVLFMTPIALGTVVAWWAYPPADVRIGAICAMAYLMLLAYGSYERQAEFVQRLDANRALGETAATVQLLLNDFEAQTADWLWQVDAQGRIVAPNARFAEAAGRKESDLAGHALIALFDPGPARDTLARHLASGAPFRDLVLTLTIAGETWWWSLSARPMHDDDTPGMRGVAADVTAQKRAEERVNHMAHYDSLTNLANRVLFNQTLTQALERRRANDPAVALLYLDLDRFKSVNDTLGHPIGDRLLCEVARRLEAAVRHDDIVARLGGDEFALIIRSPAAHTIAETAAQRIIEAVREPCVFDGVQVLTSTSIGIAVARPGECDAATLMQRSDLALYAAKAQGRNCFAHFEPGMDAAARERRDMEIDMRAALTRGEFLLHYQPAIDIASGQTVGYEALVRWNHPTRGVLYPGAFIPLAEETGLILPLGDWILNRAVEDLASWPDHLRVAVNLSPSQLRSGHVLGTIMRALAHGNVAPHRLELEITESTTLHNNETSVAQLHKLRNMGVRIALDDFGTGHSSLNYLRSFPFHKMKIDRCFVEGLGQREDALPMVRAVIALAHSLNMATTAEGVERPEQLDILRAEGCTEAQGYLFAQPEQASGIADLAQPADASRRSA